MAVLTFFLGGILGFAICSIIVASSDGKTKAEQDAEDKAQLDFIRKYKEDKNEW